MTPAERERQVALLRRARPKSRLLRVSVVLLVGLVLAAWIGGDFDWRTVISESSFEHAADFLQRARPAPVRHSPWDAAAVLTWAGDLMRTTGWKAAGLTLAISVGAIVLAALAAAVLALFAARTVAVPAPFLPSTRPPAKMAGFVWALVRGGTRLLLVFLRSIPEYVWAFLLFGILGANAWPAVLALAIHNAGILGKLTAESVENLPPGPLRALRGLGAGRRPVALFGIYPAVLPRFLLYVFYRWETCVREATVLGMLGVISLGYWIDDAHHRLRYDQMVLWILVGAAIVILGDLLSALARGVVRRAA